jgi:prevent-host-death family protein
MIAVRIGELKERADELVRRVEATGEPIEILEDGRRLAKLVPVGEETATQEELDEFWREWDELSREIGEAWPAGVTAADAINDVRRDL